MTLVRQWRPSSGLPFAGTSDIITGYKKFIVVAKTYEMFGGRRKRHCVRRLQRMRGRHLYERNRISWSVTITEDWS